MTIPWTAPIIFSLLLVIGYGSFVLWSTKESLNFDQLFMAKFTFYLVDFLLLAFSAQKALRNYVVVALFLLVSTELTTNFWISFKHMPFGSQATFAQDYRKHSQLIDEKWPQHQNFIA